MKVVLFCGGLGTRLRDYSDVVPKPMAPIGYRPILWQIMKYYAHFGHKEFILALGYKADIIKDYFINYDETITNDFVYSKGGKELKLLNSDIDDWKITFVDTGLNSNVGMRFMKIKEFVQDDEMFLANYADGLTDMHLPTMIDHFMNQKNKVASLMAYKPIESFHTIAADESGEVTAMEPMSNTPMWLNAGYFIFRKEIFDYINYGEELVQEPFHRLIDENKLSSFKFDGFWRPMDTFKDKMILDDMMEKGNAVWEVWNKCNSKG